MVNISCNKHILVTNDKKSPCQCILQMDEEIRSLIKCWPCKDYVYLYPKSFQSHITNRAIKDVNSLLLKVPRYSDNIESPTKKKPTGGLKPAPKYKPNLNGRRLRTNGECNPSARKHPANRREGGRKRSSSFDDVSRKKKCPGSHCLVTNVAINWVLVITSKENVCPRSTQQWIRMPQVPFTMGSANPSSSQMTIQVSV